MSTALKISKKNNSIGKFQKNNKPTKVIKSKANKLSDKNRQRYIFSAISRYQKLKVKRFHEDISQTVELACLMTEDDHEAINIVRRELQWLTGERLPLSIPIVDHYIAYESFIEDEEVDSDYQKNLERLWAILENINPVYREVILKVFIEDTPREYVADEMSMTGTEFGTVLRTAIGRVRVLCKKNGIEPIKKINSTKPRIFPSSSSLTKWTFTEI